MAILRLRPEPKEVDDEYFGLEYADSPDSDEFKSFRRDFYKYQYEFALRSKNISKKLIDFYEKLAIDEHVQSFYGVSESPPLQLRKYNIDVYIDFNLSKDKAEELFNKTSKEILLQIKTMYDVLHKEYPCYITDYPKIANGNNQNIKRLFESWDKAIAVFDLYEKQINKNYAQISRDLDWFDIEDAIHCSDKVKIQLDNAIRLIEATSNGSLFSEASIAITANKKRKKVAN